MWANPAPFLQCGEFWDEYTGVNPHIILNYHMMLDDAMGSYRNIVANDVVLPYVDGMARLEIQSNLVPCIYDRV